MNKIIIDNQSDLDDEMAVILVKRVISNGRISNEGKQYCYLTGFTIATPEGDKEYNVATDLNKKSDKFIIL
jgi:hypothetical protein